MDHKLVDCRGLACPHPVINTKKALESQEFDTVTTIVDNDVACQNVTLFAQNAGYLIEKEKRDGAYHLTIGKDNLSKKAATTENIAESSSAIGSPVYFITTNSLGQGSPDLGSVLMKSLCTTLAAMNPPPAAILLLNTGVFLACKDSPALEQLDKLNTTGTTILACGTCLDYYKIKDKLCLGTISNMFDINNWLCGSHKVITIA